jgi:hypothetical protein
LCPFWQVNPERTGIEINFEQGKKLDAVENLLSGRLIDLKEIFGVDMDPLTTAPIEAGYIPETVNSLFAFALVTREDVLQFRFTEEGGGPWLLAMMATIAFMSVPPPSSRSNTTMGNGSPTRGSNGTSSSAVGSDHRSLSMAAGGLQVEFATVSGQVFSASGDVQLFLEGLINDKHKFVNVAAVKEAAMQFSEVLRYLSEVKCNKEVATQFGERMEDCVRVLADPTVGILNVASPSHSNSIAQYMRTLSLKLTDCVDYLIGVSSVGWLAVCLKPAGAANTKYKMMDLEVTSVMNQLIKAVGDNGLMFGDVVYAGADVRKSIISLNGAESIYKDTSKIRALAKLIQTTQSDLEEELRLIVMGDNSSNHSVLHTFSSSSVMSNSNQDRYTTLQPNENRTSRTSRGTGSNSAGNSLSEQQQQDQGRGGFCRYLCCCFGTSRDSVSATKNNRADLNRRLI